MSKLQEKADEFDCDLYRLIDRAWQYQDAARNNAEAGKWAGIALKLQSARGAVRSMMSEKDRKATA